jgi:hypothetical protein
MTSRFNVDKTNTRYKGPFNRVLSDARVFTPKDTAIVTPNSDTPYAMLEVDLRAEPIVFCVPKVEKSRYYSAQLTDMYSFNYGYVGSRATGSDAGCYMIAGPDWKGDTTAGAKKVFQRPGCAIVGPDPMRPIHVNIDSLASEGMTFFSFYAQACCTPGSVPPRRRVLMVASSMQTAIPRTAA